VAGGQQLVLAKRSAHTALIDTIFRCRGGFARADR
jgi:hypothetical protein